MCKLLNVCRSAYYAWLNALPSFRTQENVMLLERIKMIFIDSRKTYGTRRIKRALANMGLQVGRRRIGKLMAQLGLICKAKRKFKVTTGSKHSLHVSPNLLQRNFSPSKADQCYAGDITYIPTQ